MKKTLMILLLALTAITVKADDYDYLVILDNSSNATSFVSDGLTLTYNGTTLIVNPASGNAATFDTKSLSKMYFSSTATGLVSINAEVDGESVLVYDMGGRPYEYLQLCNRSLRQIAQRHLRDKRQSENH